MLTNVSQMDEMESKIQVLNITLELYIWLSWWLKADAYLQIQRSPFAAVKVSPFLFILAPVFLPPHVHVPHVHAPTHIHTTMSTSPTWLPHAPLKSITPVLPSTYIFPLPSASLYFSTFHPVTLKSDTFYKGIPKYLG